MKRLFKTSLFGYNRKQVNGYVLSLRKDYERELSKKKDRMLELSQENRDLKSKLLEYEERLSDYEEREIFISKALVKAEESAQAIMKECYHRIDMEKYKIKQEQEKWKTREREIIRQLLAFQQEAYSLMESFQSEINYLTSKELIKLQNEDKADVKDEEILNVSSM
ncbi:MAG: DivIVA domain-containing protein [Caldicoprobacterales bacterium]|jgi:cell division initiation protein|nr:hypothetical protein [Clostridiales bacterium]